MSLWHDMQRRDGPSSGGSSEAGEDGYADQAAWGTVGAGGLFDAEDPTAGSAATKPASAAWPSVRAAQSPVVGGVASTSGAVWKGPVAQRGPSQAPVAELAARRDSDAVLASSRDALGEAGTGEASQGKEEDGRSRQKGVEQAQADQQHTDSQAGSSSRQRLSGSGGEVSEPSSSMVGNLISTVRSGITRALAALPPALRHVLRDGPGSAAAGNSDDEEDAEEAVRSREDIKKDLLLGHLLALLTEGGEGMPAHALPALASNLAETGLLPRWVQVLSAGALPSPLLSLQ